MGTASEKYSEGKYGGIREKEEFTAFFRKLYPSLLFYASRMLPAEQAEDVVQDAFLELWKRRGEIRAGERLHVFMYRSVYTKCLNKIKHEKIVARYSTAAREIFEAKAAHLAPDNNEILKIIEGEELGEQIDKIIDELPDKCREVFKLSYLHDLRNKEIADVLGITVKTVESHMYKALKLLRNKLSHLTSILTILLFC
ncbi:MAG: RNA polymerase sigma-70 factor [Rikenellaceae bacterium]|nr:RNA polymerase sigma-70 factor [Rikenellaceae bacterium]